MLIGRVSDGRESGHSGNGDDRNNLHEYQTANELYEIMAEGRRFDSNDETLTAGDLVILYKNLDIGTKLITEAKYSQTKPTNQYVETIVYNDDPDSDESDIEEICSAEDIRNVMMINKERIDLLSNTSSYDSNLCQKFGNVAVNHSNLAGLYNENFLFKDPFIKDQLNSIIPNETTILPTSLLDYICCKRLEDNYNFYMDSVINYVQHTIEHLKRISNGDYLTEKAKKKWKELDDPTKKDENTQSLVLANSISIPLRVELKQERIKSTFNDVVHSAVDIRSLTKILERKIVLEIPKLINGTYKLFSKCYNDNLIISCKTDFVKNETQSRVDVVLKLNKSEPRHVVSKLNSIMILQTSPQTSIQDFLKSAQLPALCEKENIEVPEEESPKIIELNDNDEVIREFTYESSVLTNKSQETYEDSLFGTDTDVSSVSPRCRINDFAETFMSYQSVSEEKTYTDEQTEANFHVTTPNDLRYTVHRLNMNSPVPEESEVSIKKKKSATKIRIKSPYENSSHAMEEKKRKRLLEIRERRENKKKALSENCKISKHKYSKGAVMAQASNSVTKLSITNKSFYNSIYGQAVNIEGKSIRADRKNRDLKIVVELENCEDETQDQTPKHERNREKYINHSYYLDDADTEVMRIQMKQMSDTDNTTAGGTASSSVASDDFGSSLLKELINPSTVNSNQLIPTASNISQNFLQTTEIFKKIIIDMDRPPLETIQSVSNMVHFNFPKDSVINTSKVQKECTTADECRKSIDEIYNLMNQKGTTGTFSSHTDKNLEQTTKKVNGSDSFEQKDRGSDQPSDSGTSLKHHIVPSIPSCFSFDKNKSEQQIKRNLIKKTETPVPTSKSKILANAQSSRSYEDKLKRDRKTISSPVNKISENPLKAISQLLHEFDNIKKNRSRNDSKPNKKPDNDNKKEVNRQVTFKRPLQQEQQSKDSEPASRISTPKGRKSRLNALVTIGKQPNGRPSMDEKSYLEKTNKKKVTDLIDEVKEARGEAVRGPPKVQSRLDSLAQPKKSYIQAHNEQYPNRNVRHVTATNRQRYINSTVAERREVTNARQKKVTDIVGCPKASSAVPPLGSRRSSSSSPDGNQRGSPVPVTAPSHKPNVPETPEILKTKMDTVESYVKNHYGRTAPIQDLKDFVGAQKSRVPLIPTDLDIGSVTSSRTAEESTTLGKKLHYMIDTMINTTSPTLASLREKKGILLNNKNKLKETFVQNIEQFDEIVSNTDYPIDIFGDKSITTAVASLPKDNDVDETVHHNNIDFIAYDIQPFNSTTELERLENALYRRLSAGAFHKRLRIKNLTLTPKHSLQQVFVLHSGDAGSMVVKSTVTQPSKNNSKLKTTSELNKPVQSNSHIDWTFADFPTQVTTLGYALPIANRESAQKTFNEDVTSDSYNSRASGSTRPDSRANKIIQCFKGSCIEPLQDQSVQASSVVDSVKPVRFEILQDAENKSTLKIKIDGRFSQENTTKEMRKSPKTSIELCESQESKLNVLSKNKFVSKRSDIDNTTSLDILVGLLNEIKNITTCQTYITKHEASRLDANENSERTELQFILKNAEMQEDSLDLSPENALSYDSLRHVDQQPFMGAIIPSIHSIQYEPLLSHSVVPLHHDKEVNVSISGIEYVHTFTEVPSQFLPITVHHSTNVTSSLIGVISQPSEQSLYSFSDYQTLYCNSSFNRIIELPNVEPKKSFHTLKCTEITEEEINSFKREHLLLSCERPKINNAREVKNNVSNFETLLKMKRDVLVTVYSILVMTVFAALSFPEILYKV